MPWHHLMFIINRETERQNISKTAMTENSDIKLSQTSDAMSQNYEPQFGIFHDLIKFRVREILLVSSFYDAFVLEEDGRLSEKIFSEYIDLNLRFIPRISRVSTAEEALKAIKQGSFDMVITMTRIADMDPFQFGLKLKELNPDIPVILLTYEWITDQWLEKFRTIQSIDKVFYWTGDTRILLAIIKYVEDLKNVDNDTRLGVRTILVIEDSPKFYSIFLPIIYTEIMTQTRLLISEGVNDVHRLLRMRARPKILMAENYEQGLEIYRKYKKNLLGIITDIQFKRKGVKDKDAGFRFARKIKKEIPDLPIIMQSSNLKNKKIATDNGLDFLYKNSDNLLHDLQSFILSQFGFGDFVFKDPGGNIYGRASTLQEFEKMIQIIPSESLLFHSRRNHISIWLRARTEFEAAERLRPKQVSDFSGLDELRNFILGEIRKIINKNQYGVITDFGKTDLNSFSSFIRLGNGSMGGKARSIAFLNTLLAQTKLDDIIKDISIKTPQTFVICSDVFDKFIEINDLLDFALTETENQVIAQRFLEARLPSETVQDLNTLLENVKYPLAVRSSSILEDSQMLPFSGLYSTYMLSNNHPDISHRSRQLGNAIKLVFASIFYKSPKVYIKNTNFRIEEEKMAVVIQRVVGQPYKNGYYPVISGVAQSFNFYPISHQEADDGIVQLALGLGPIIVEGSQIYRFSPRYPNMPPPFSSPYDFVRQSQNYFYALDLSHPERELNRNDEKFNLKKMDLDQSEDDGTLFFVGSTFSSQDNAIRDTLSVEGIRLITFANILKFNLFPLPEVLTHLLEIGREAFGSHIEIEFALNLFKDKEKKPEFHLLQVRPMVAGKESVEISLDNIPKDDIICQSTHAIGNGVFKDIHDLIYVDPGKFDPAKTRIIASEIEKLNQMCHEENRGYILLGFGRWGTADPWLGIPVEWHQISKSRIVIESNLDNFKIDPSQGSHFFHNMISLKVGYFHIRSQTDNEFVDWNWLRGLSPHRREKFVNHVRFENPFTISIDAHRSKGIITKPAS